MRLYAIQFKNGTVKVGHTSNMEARLYAHRSSGLVHSNPATREWISPRHYLAHGAESQLKQIAMRHSDGVIQKEWFINADFDAIVRDAEVEIELSPEVFIDPVTKQWTF